jgi:hypothetical protein
MYAATPSYNGTKIVGMCDMNATSLETLQKNALKTHLPVLLLGVGEAGAGVKVMVKNMLQRTSWFGALVDDTDNSTVLEEKQIINATLVRTLRLVINVEDGVEYVTSIYVSSGLAEPTCHHVTRPQDRGIGVNLTALQQLASGLPRLRYFECKSCNGNANASKKAAANEHVYCSTKYDKSIVVKLWSDRTVARGTG